MGTRNLTMVIYNGKYKVAQYGQWDGYFEGQGKIILEFIKTVDIDLFKKQLKKVSWIKYKELRKIWLEFDVDIENEKYINVEIYDKFSKKYPELSRNHGADILNYIYKNAKDNILLKNKLSFVGKSLFCEYAYLLQLDSNNLEIYKGFNKEDLTENDRFHNFKYDKKNRCNYKQIKIFETLSFEYIKNNNIELES